MRSTMSMTRRIRREIDPTASASEVLQQVRENTHARSTPKGVEPETVLRSDPRRELRFEKVGRDERATCQGLTSWMPEQPQGPRPLRLRQQQEQEPELLHQSPQKDVLEGCCSIDREPAEQDQARERTT